MRKILYPKPDNKITQENGFFYFSSLLVQSSNNYWLKSVLFLTQTNLNIL